MRSAGCCCVDGADVDAAVTPVVANVCVLDETFTLEFPVECRGDATEGCDALETPTVTVTFSVSSDDFCARVIEVKVRLDDSAAAAPFTLLQVEVEIEP